MLKRLALERSSLCKKGMLTGNKKKKERKLKEQSNQDLYARDEEQK